MPYRYSRLELGVAYDSTLAYPVFGPIKVFFDQVKDLQSFSTDVRIAPGAAEAQLSLAPIQTGYFIAILSDYPVMVRLNGAAATQFTLHSNGVPATNVGAPLPDQSAFIMTGTVTSLYLAPIAGAAQTANVKVCVTGDPLNAYT